MKAPLVIAVVLVLAMSATLPAAYAAPTPSINLGFAWNKASLNVYIVAKDSIQSKYIPDAKAAVEKWSSDLKVRSGNANAWNFNVFTSTGFPSDVQIKSKPADILIEIKAGQNNHCQGGGAHTATVMRLVDKFLKGYVYASVTTCSYITSPEFKTLTMHEFGHTLGLVHAWNEPGDMMCSIEKTFYIFTVNTCPAGMDQYKDIRNPSGFDLDAVISLYGTDGMALPNNAVKPFKYTTALPGTWKTFQLVVENQKYEGYSVVIVSGKIHNTPIPGEPVVISIYDGMNTKYYWYLNEQLTVMPDGTFRSGYVVSLPCGYAECSAEKVRVEAWYGYVKYEILK